MTRRGPDGGDVDEDDEYGNQRESDAPGDPPTERVRIIGAQPAGSMTSGEVPVRPNVVEERFHGFDEMLDTTSEPTLIGSSSISSSEETLWVEEIDVEVLDTPSSIGGLIDSEPDDPEPDDAEPDDAEPEVFATSPQLPHWTDPPTGQVPAILDRRTDQEAEEESWTQLGDSGPSWRTSDREWEDNTFEPALLADDQTRMGALEDTPVEQRRPWEFGNLANAGGPSADEDTTTSSWWEDDEAVERLDDADRPAARSSVGSDLVSGTTVMPETTSVPVREAVTAISSSPLRRTESPLAPPAGPRVSGRGAGRRGSAGPGAAGAGAGATAASGATGPAPAAGGSRNLRIAVSTGIGVAAVALACLKLGALSSMVLSTVIVTLAAAEYYAAVRRAGHRPATLLGLVATVAAMVVAYTKGVTGVPLVLALMVMASLVWYLVGAEQGSALDGMSVTVFGFAWIGLLGAFASLMLAPSQYPHRHGVAFLLGAGVAVVGEDVGALVVGRWLGRHRMAPGVSPNKTWEGFAGGAVLAVVLSVAITGQVHPWTPAKAAVLGVVAAVLAPLGDLCESLVKRELRLKDMGSLLPGHGGVLDRFDAMLFVLPATYYLVRVLHLG